MQCVICQSSKTKGISNVGVKCLPSEDPCSESIADQVSPANPTIADALRLVCSCITVAVKPTTRQGHGVVSRQVQKAHSSFTLFDLGRILAAGHPEDDGRNIYLCTGSSLVCSSACTPAHMNRVCWGPAMLVPYLRQSRTSGCSKKLTGGSSSTCCLSASFNAQPRCM